VTSHEHGPFPSDETLAAFIDGRLDEEARRRVMDHLIGCEECYAVFAASSDVKRGDAPPVPIARRGAATWGAIAAAAALLAGVLLFTPLRDFVVPQSPMAKIAAAAPNHRIFHGRLSEIAFRPFELAERSKRDDDDADADADTLRLKKVEADFMLTARKDPTAANLHALGVSQLLLGKWNASIRTLERAVEADARVSDVSLAVQRSKSVPLISDLAAAYEARFYERKDGTDAAAALNAASRAFELQRSPVTLWNLATALQDQGLRAESAARWRDFLRISDDPGATAEAKKRLAAATDATGAEEWDGAKAAIVADADAGRVERVRALAVPRAARVRTFIENELLPSWGKTGSTHDLTLARTLAVALNDALLTDSIARIDHAPPAARSSLARGHQLYAQAYASSDAGANEPALRQFEEAQALLARGGSPFALQADVYVAACTYSIRNYERAIAVTNDVERRLDASRYPIVAALNRWTRGTSRVSLGQLNEGLDDYGAALDAFARGGDAGGVLTMQSILATNYDRIGDTERSWRFRTEALQRLDSLGGAADRAPQILNSAAAAALRIGLPYAARHFAEAEQAEAVRRHWEDYVINALVCRSDVDEALGDGSSSARHAAEMTTRAAHIANETLRRTVLGDPDVIRVALRAVSKAADRVALVERATGDAQASNDHLRAAELLSALGGEYLRDGRPLQADRALSVAAQEVEQQRPTLDLALADAYRDTRRDIYDQLTDLALARGDDRGALEIVERSRDATTGKRVAATASLPSDVTAVVVASRPKALLLWSMRNGVVRLDRASIAAGDLAHLIDEIRAGMRDDAAFRTRTERLSAFLVAPWIERARGSRIVVVVADDVTAAVPFAALVDGPLRKKLVEEFAIVTAPSLAAFERAAVRDAALRARPQHIAVMGAAVGDETSRALDVRPELTAIAGVYADADVIRDDAVTDAHLLAGVAQSDVAQFAGHAVVNARNPLESALLVTPANGKRCLYAYEIASQRFDRTRIVVLSACGSARLGDLRNGSVGSLSGAFVAAGVPSVVGTLWDVRDGESAALLRRLHEEIRSGRDAATALRAAQLEAMRTQPPAIWAAFQVVGGVS